MSRNRRQGIPRGQRKKVIRTCIERYGNKCFYCGTQWGEGGKERSIDHRIPYSEYPDFNVDNYVLACRACNCVKSNKTEAEFLESEWLAERRMKIRAKLQRSCARAVDRAAPGETVCVGACRSGAWVPDGAGPACGGRVQLQTLPGQTLQALAQYEQHCCDLGGT